MNGKSGVVECAFVRSDVTEAPYFANPILLGKDGLQENLGMGQLSDFEKKKMGEVCCRVFQRQFIMLSYRYFLS